MKFLIKENPDAPAPAWTMIPGLNSVLGLQNVGGKPNIYHKLLCLFVNNHRFDIVKLQQALLEGDLTKVKLLAHTLKSVSGTLGAESLHGQAALLEYATKNAQSIVNIALIVNKLDAELTHLISAILTLPSLNSGKVELTLDQEKLIEILGKLDSLLAEDNGEAVNLFTEFRTDLDAMLGDKSLEFAQHMNAYAFVSALAILRSVIGHEQGIEVVSYETSTEL